MVGVYQQLLQFQQNSETGVALKTSVTPMFQLIRNEMEGGFQADFDLSQPAGFITLVVEFVLLSTLSFHIARAALCKLCAQGTPFALCHCHRYSAFVDDF